MVRETLNRFKEGIERGNLEIGPQITTEDFYPFFKGFYESLATGYSQYKISFPMEIGHLKILKSGLKESNSAILGASALAWNELEKIK